MTGPRDETHDATMSESMSYAGFCTGCGVMCAACVETGRTDRERIANFVADMVRWGARVERVPSSRVRAELDVCRCAAVPSPGTPKRMP